MPSFVKILNGYISLQKALFRFQVKIFNLLIAPFTAALAVHVSSLIDPPDAMQLRAIFQFIAIVIYLSLPLLLIEASVRKIFKKQGGFLRPFKREAPFLVSQAALLFLIKSYEDVLTSVFPSPQSAQICILTAASLMVFSYTIIHTLLYCLSHKN